MAVTESKLIRDFVGAIKDGTKEKTKAYETPATVTRIEDGTAWVHVPGGVEETPVQLTINATEGDTVRVRVANGRATIVGNVTNPPTDDATAKEALSNANSAIQSAKNASIAAASAESSAAAAKESATEAKRTTDEINAYADTAGKTVTQILHDGETAGTAAEQAKTDAASAKVSAENASEYAARALGNLSTVQSVTETLNWITAHGTMTLTTDTELDPTHVYFVADNNGDYVVGGNHYSVVTEPNVDDIATYYELGIDESLNNYVATHLSVTEEGLWIIPDAGGNKVLIATGQGSTYKEAGTYIIGKVNGVDTALASFLGSGAVIGKVSNSTPRAIVRSNGFIIVKGFEDVDPRYIARLELGPTGSGKYENPYYFLGAQNPYSYISPFDPTDDEGDPQSYFLGAVVFAPNTGKKSCCVVPETTAGQWVETEWKQLLIGAYSMVEGDETYASGTASHSEGSRTLALGDNSHAEGLETTSIGQGTHCEGFETKAVGNYSHAEGRYAIALGRWSHAQNDNTVAGYDCQTAIGKNNDNQSDNAFEIGNGTLSARSNAFTVDWDGNTVASGDITDGNGNVLADKADSTDLANYLPLTGGTLTGALNGTSITASGNISANNALLALDTTATSGTDKEIYDALVSLGWDSDVIV